MDRQNFRNAYHCEKCGGRTVTVNLVDGTTPFMIECRAKWPGECGGMAQSEFYRIDQGTPAEWGFYRPDEQELTRLESIHPGTRDYVERGALCLRKLDSAERVTFGGSSPRFA